MRNRLFRQVISVLLLFSLIVTMLPQNIFAERNEFSDVESYKDEIYTLVDLGIIHGFTDNTFRPQTTITRGQGIAMIIREMGVSTENRKDPGFKDIKEGSRFYKEIATAKELGIVDGKVDGTFGVNEEMTRAQMAKILVSAYDLKLIESNNKSFKDVPTSHWSHPYISILVSNGITVGYHDGTFKPQAKLTRLHFSLFLYRYIHEVKEQTAQPGEVITNGENKTVLLEDTILIDEDLESSIDIEAKDENEYKITFSESVDIKEGDVFVLPATDEFPGGLAVKAEKITEKNNQLIIETSQPEIDEVFYSIQGEFERGLQLEDIQTAPGVTIKSASKSTPYWTIPIDDIVLKLDIGTENVSINGEVEIQGVLKGEVEWGILLPDSFDFGVELNEDLNINVEVGYLQAAGKKERFELFKTVPVPTSIPFLALAYTVYCDVNANGKVSLDFESTLVERVGVKYDERDGLSIYPEDKLTGEIGNIEGVNAEISLEATFLGGELNTFLAGINAVDFGIDGGWEGTAKTVTLGPNGILNCLELNHALFYRGYVSASIVKQIIDDAKAELEFKGSIPLHEKMFGNYLTNIELNHNNVELDRGDTIDLAVTGDTVFGDPVDITEDATFKSSNPSVVEVTNEGKVTVSSNAKDGDTATITVIVKQGSKTFKETVKVTVGVHQSEMGTLVGKVIDARNEEPIEDAVISLYKGKELVQQLQTKADGSYKVGLAPATYEIKVEHDKYIPVTDQVKVTAQNIVTYDVKMNPGLDVGLLGFEQGAGYEQGAYDKLALYPTQTNWSGQSRFIGPENPKTAKPMEPVLVGDGVIWDNHYVVGSDGTIYYSKYDRNLYAIHSDGSKKWELDINAYRMVIGENGIIYVMSGGGFTRDEALYAIQPSGKIEWKCELEYNTYWPENSSIMLGADGSIYLYDGDNYFYKINSNGEVQWDSELRTSVAPVLAKDGNIYIIQSSTRRIYLYKIDSATGKSTKIYEYKSDSVHDISLHDFKVGSDGTFYMTSNSTSSDSRSQVGELLAISSNGEKKWGLNFSEKLGGISISKDGTIYMNATGRSTGIDSETMGVLYAITSSGEIKWEREAGGSVYEDASDHVNSPVIGADGIIYNCGMNRGDITYYAFYPEDGSEKWKIPPDSSDFSLYHLFLGGNGVLYDIQYVYDTYQGVCFVVIKDEE